MHNSIQTKLVEEEVKNAGHCLHVMCILAVAFAY